MAVPRQGSRDRALRLEDVDLGDPAFWALPRPTRLEAFALLRQLDAPVRFTARTGSGEAFYALVRHADVKAASRRPHHFASAPGVTTPQPAAWAKAVFGTSMVNLDGEEHAVLRRIVSRAFTPRLLAGAEENIRVLARRLVDEAVAERADDLMASAPSRLPLEVICDLMGVPEHHRPLIARQIEHASAYVGVRREGRDRLRVPGRGLRSLARMHLVMVRLARERRLEPGDDLVSALVRADVDGQALTSRQLGSFFSLLLVAGVETTRNAIAHGMDLLARHPEQRALLESDFERYIDGAVDEIVRHSTPIIQFRRTVGEPCSLGGRSYRPGEKVVLFYASANRDETVFADPDAFDITRSPNPHLGYGGGGPHHCVGAHLARLEMKALLGELLSRLSTPGTVGAPELVDSSFDNRVRALPFSFGRAKPAPALPEFHPNGPA
ncbi:cytochrome P450 [Streptomyces fulvorobeus]|uniref:Cytochrome P450 n=1 Tax=Streptomyces fulvorobeus TaxID=284028 RepID=A0A7J0CE40_9ACTN|nr:cytochrome P450 [Streptomyces fulvorobeus]NYE43493.1 cytochrome P450 [Streptomyces fulvorobeus]GFM99966.1 cytochrome P450 [Streptomyces fulvorobeus]